MTGPAVLERARREDRTEARARRALRARISWIVTSVAAATIAVGLVVHGTTGRLGTALPPFVMAFGPRAQLLPTAIAVAVLAACVALLPWVVASSLRPVAVDLVLFAVALAAGLALGAVRGGPHDWWRIFDLGPGGSFEAKNEYLPGLPSLSYGVRFYLDRFAELVPSQPVNVAGHPPGPLLLVHALGLHTAQGLAALCAAATAACAPLAHRLGRTLEGERAGRIAGALCALSPIVLLFGISAFDAVFAAAGAAAATLLVARGMALRALGAVALAGAALLSWALLGVGAWAVVVVGRREGPRRAALLAAGCAIALVALNGALAAATGYDPIGTLRATEQVYRASVAERRPLWFWAFGSPVAWGVLLGLPIAALALRALAAGRAAALATAVVVVVAAGGGFTKAETERIWLFLAPLACVAAASALDPRRVRLVLLALAVQALAVQVLFATVW